MVSDETLLNYQGWIIHFTVHTDVCDQKLGTVISQNNKPIYLFSKKVGKAQITYTKTGKDLLSIVAVLNQLR